MAKIKFTQLETLTTQSVNLSALMPVVQDGENYNIALSSLPSSGGGGGSYDDSLLQSTSATWDSTYTTVTDNSAAWDAHTDPYDDSLLQSTSATWDSTYTTVSANSATWRSAGSASFAFNDNGASDQIVGDIPASWRNVTRKPNDQLIIIGTSCTDIGASAFVGHNNSDGGLHLPDSVLTIGTFAFQSYAVNSVVKGTLRLPANLERVEMGVFQLAKFSGQLTLPSGLIYIGSNAFAEGIYSGDLTIPNQVTEVGFNAFYNNSFSGNLTLPTSLTTVGTAAFRNNAGLTTCDCYTTKTAIDVSNSLLGTGIATIHARATDATWTAGAGQTIGDKTGITVIKDLT